MYLSAKIINLVAISFPFISMIVYSRLLLLIFWYKTIKKSPELYLFYCRFVFDLVICVISLVKMIIYGLSLTSLYDFFLNNHWLTFMFVWPVSSFSSLRAILVLFIALDRVCATYLPITFFKYRKLIPTFAIVGVVLSYSIIDTSVVFIICKVDLNTPTDCINALCIFGPCYQQYWLVFSKLFYAMIVILTLMLCAKLFIWNKLKKHNVNGELRRANRLALIDAFITIVFDFAPPIIHSTYPNFFDYVGAINSVSQTLGFVVESWLTTLNLEKRYQVKKVTASGKVVFRQSTADMTSLAACFGLSIYAIAVNFIYRFFRSSKANRLALIDTGFLVCFFLVPPIIHASFPGAYDDLGPVNLTFKTTGFAIESFFVYSNFRQQITTTTRVKSWSDT
ncbi:Protein CBG01294 [Caenorhabditis briggsae]|uniref:Protein CBG01294 n=1 Tax=Caenorhabditis briggsae TaxID=6238 RepID=A8WQ25_CAEBR|nr:Protein CBG01294 [Caenorhabditis briggsae]CAP22583.1 Protein CBG01294 [Caenorhabditis briggsae]